MPDGRKEINMERTPVTIYTDGACIGNPGPGGWAAILTFGEIEKILRGYDCATTNNKMELTAVVQAVKALKKPCDVTIITDSTYVMMTNAKWEKWQKKSTYKNKELWDELMTAGKSGKHKISFQHVYGHTGEVMNERCDYIAKEQAKKARKGDAE